MNGSSRLGTNVGSLALANPILTASGTYGSGKEYDDFLDLSIPGAVVTKSVTRERTRGNPPPRVVETPAGMLNAIGLQNEGVEHFKKELLPPLLEKAAAVVVNVAGKSEDDYLAVSESLSDTGVAALEINISCPNVKEGGIAFGVCAETAAGLVAKVRSITDLPLWVKLSPNVTDICAIARSVEAAGADALTVANTYLGMAIDIETRRPLLGNITGGLSGPCIHPLALRLVWQVSDAVKIPVVAVGGVKSIREVIGFLLAGASAVQVGTMNFVEPGIIARLVRELEVWLEEHDAGVTELIGGMEQSVQ